MSISTTYVPLRPNAVAPHMYVTVFHALLKPLRASLPRLDSCFESINGNKIMFS